MHSTDIIVFNKPYELQLSEQVVKDLALPAKDDFHPLSIPVEKLDPQFEYRWKAYAVSEKSLYETGKAQEQIMENLQASVQGGWMPVPSLQYPFLLTPAIRKYSTGRFLRYNGLILCCKLKPLLIGVKNYISGGGVKDVSTISFSTPLCIGKQINSCSD